MIKMALVLWNNKELRIHELYERESKKNGLRITKHPDNSCQYFVLHIGSFTVLLTHERLY